MPTNCSSMLHNTIGTKRERERAKLEQKPPSSINHQHFTYNSFNQRKTIFHYFSFSFLFGWGFLNDKWFLLSSPWNGCFIVDARIFLLFNNFFVSYKHLEPYASKRLFSIFVPNLELVQRMKETKQQKKKWEKNKRSWIQPHFYLNLIIGAAHMPVDDLK